MMKFVTLNQIVTVIARGSAIAEDRASAARTVMLWSIWRSSARCHKQAWYRQHCNI